MKKQNNIQKIKEIDKSILKNKIALILPFILVIVFFFCNAVSYTGYYSITEETDDKKSDYIVDFGDEAEQGISLFNIVIGNNRKVFIQADVEVNLSGKHETQDVMIICPNIPGLLIASILLVVGLIIGIVPGIKKAKLSMIQLLLSILLVLGSFIFIVLKVTELPAEFLEMSRISVLKTIMGDPNYKFYTSSVQVIISYQFILLGLAIAADVILKGINLFLYRKKSVIE